MPTISLGFLRSIATNVPVYRDCWARKGISTDNIESLTQLPVLDKQDMLRAGVAARLDQRFAAQPLSQESTSGSSGEPMRLSIDAGARRRRQWRFLRALMSAGYRPGDRLMLISTHRRSHALTLMRWTYTDLRTDEAELLANYDATRPQVLYGPLRALMTIGERLSRSTSAHRPRVLISTAEQMQPQDQSQLLHCYGVKANDFYGMTEIGLYAWRGPDEPHYRIVANDIQTEFLPSATDASLDRLVVTTTRPCAMPLVRYDTGDLVRRDRSSPGFPINAFVGREIDGILLPGGNRLSPYRLTLAMETVEGIDRYQIVQQADLTVELSVRTSRADAAAVRERARLTVTAVLGNGIVVRAKPMSADPPQLAEKFRPVRSFAKAAA